jgi:hypothetical protein
LRIGWPLIRAFCAKSGPVDRPERAFGSQFFSPHDRRCVVHRSACTRVGERVARAITMHTREAVRHRRNAHFIDISVIRENDRGNSGNTKRLRMMPFRRALFSAGDRRKPRRLHTKLSGVTVIFFPL